MVGSMAIDVAIGRLAKVAATKFNPYVAGITTITDAIEATKAVDKAKNFANNVNYIGGALSTTSSVFFTS